MIRTRLRDRMHHDVLATALGITVEDLYARAREDDRRRLETALRRQAETLRLDREEAA